MKQLEFLQLTDELLMPFIGGQLQRQSKDGNYRYRGEIESATVAHNVLNVRFVWLGRAIMGHIGRWAERGWCDPWENVDDLNLTVRLVDFRLKGPDHRVQFTCADGSFGGYNVAYDGGCLHLYSHVTDEHLRLYPKNWEDPHEEFSTLSPTRILGFALHQCAA